jgi:hypothetical protein
MKIVEPTREYGSGYRLGPGLRGVDGIAKQHRGWGHDV